MEKNTPKKTNKAKTQKQSPEQRKANLRKKQHIKYIKDVFVSSGFAHIGEMTGADFKYKERPCDFDDIYLLENVLTIVEHTAHNEENVSTHLLKKKVIFDYINSDPADFIDYVRTNFPAFARNANPIYQNHHFQVRIVYASLHALKKSTKDHVNNVFFLDYHYLRYFRTLAGTVRLSAKYELLDFLSVPSGKYAKRVMSSSSSNNSSFRGSVLPETHSHFPKGYKVVSFYVSAAALIQRAYVLRKDSWRDQPSIYQRLLVKKKIESLRRHLLDKKGVAINNIIVTLPESTKILNYDGKTQVDCKTILDVESARIELPEEYNSIGIIDGQHRAFSYYEGGSDEAKISVLREQQNLLITGIIFPDNTDSLTRDRFSARLFLEINSNQTKVKPELIQEIGVILKPFAVQSIARRVLRALSEGGPFSGQFESAFSEGTKIKTATVVNYALVPLVRPGATESLFNSWQSPDKNKLLQGTGDATLDQAVVDSYVEYCTKQINAFTGAIRSVAKGRWSTDKAIPNRLLTTVIVNGMLHCLRRLGGAGKVSDHETYKSGFAEIENFDFSQYGSNRYNQLGQDLAWEYFKVPKSDPGATETSDPGKRLADSSM